MNSKKVIVFGTGKLSLEHYIASISPNYYVDNDKNKWGIIHNGALVKNPDSLLNEDKNNLIVIIASMYVLEISEQLNSYGLIAGVHYFEISEMHNENFFRAIYKDVSKFKNIHEGKRAFIIGNGPSLTINDLELLQNEITFASNSIHVAFQETNWRPQYYTITDDMAAKNKKSTIRNIRAVKFFPKELFRTLGDMVEAYWLKENNFFGSNRGSQRFSEDISKEIFTGGTVTFFNIQLAYYMGIKKIYFLGLDFNYQGLPPTPPGDQLVYYHQEGKHKTHFHSEYHNNGEVCYYPDLNKHYQVLLYAHQFLSGKVEMYNASRSTELDIFPRVNLDEILY
ncbi:6-hydroxymethylpterin diphosphokinase MptE-like protein [Cohnella algarum]|uniref:6-hydroxymethylpterin diphosphokinase MptE-like protein n=1 Tax=Cohnella algarum TaxID=2044859 RepID=UPI001967641A|nr:6-hydroxymethylpterin diphosphokinase MptE-like protein [Cohnella algarum]MBN2980614.1 DUF115 domain-containing protein [Cohnella algarum]